MLGTVPIEIMHYAFQKIAAKLIDCFYFDLFKKISTKQAESNIKCDIYSMRAIFLRHQHDV